MNDNHQPPPDVAALAARAAANIEAPKPAVNAQVQFQYGPANAHVQRLNDVPGHGTLILLILTTPSGTVGTFWQPEHLQGLINQLTQAVTGIQISQALPPHPDPK